MIATVIGSALIAVEDFGPAVQRERFFEGLDTNSAPSVFDSRHANTARLTQSMITTK